jgi:hypothetical protein
VEILQLPALRSSCHSGSCRILVTFQLTTQLTGSQAGGHFTTSYSSLHRLTTELSLTSQLLHVTSLNRTADNSDYFTSGTRLTLLITFRHELHRKHRFHCYSPAIPRPLLAYPLPRKLFTEQLPSDSPGIFDVFTGRCLETGVYLSAYCIATAVLVVHFETSPSNGSIRRNVHVYKHQGRIW